LKSSRTGCNIEKKSPRSRLQRQLVIESRKINLLIIKKNLRYKSNEKYNLQLQAAKKSSITKNKTNFLQKKISTAEKKKTKFTASINATAKSSPSS